jgi:hypothetical protein
MRPNLVRRSDFLTRLHLIARSYVPARHESGGKKTKEIVELCARVAAASGGLFGLGEKTSNEERRVISKLRERIIEVPKKNAGSPLI